MSCAQGGGLLVQTSRNKPQGMVGKDALVKNGAGLNKHLESSRIPISENDFILDTFIYCIYLSGYMAYLAGVACIWANGNISTYLHFLMF